MRDATSQALAEALLACYERTEPLALPDDYSILVQHVSFGLVGGQRGRLLRRLQQLQGRAEALRHPVPPSARSSRIIAHYTPAECPPYGGVVVWIGRGSGTLRWGEERAPEALSPFRSGGLETYRRSLMLGDTPLIQYDRSCCPSCEVLLQAGARSVEDAQRFAEAIRSLSIAAVRADPEVAVEPLLPLLESLLMPGPVLLALTEYCPTDGYDRFFWSAFDDLEYCDAWRQRYALADQPPTFLVPTQPLSAFREDAWARSASTLATHPGIAFHLDSQASALLDGHHRALRAAQTGQRLSCITIVTPKRIGRGLVQRRTLATTSWCCPGMQSRRLHGKRQSHRVVAGSMHRLSCCRGLRLRRFHPRSLRFMSSTVSGFRCRICDRGFPRPGRRRAAVRLVPAWRVGF